MCSWLRQIPIMDCSESNFVFFPPEDVIMFFSQPISHLNSIINIYFDSWYSKACLWKDSLIVHSSFCFVSYQILKVESSIFGILYFFYYPRKGQNAVQARKKLFNLCRKDVLAEHESCWPKLFCQILFWQFSCWRSQLKLIKAK